MKIQAFDKYTELLMHASESRFTTLSIRAIEDAGADEPRDAHFRAYYVYEKRITMISLMTRIEDDGNKAGYAKACLKSLEDFPRDSKDFPKPGLKRAQILERRRPLSG